MFKEGDLVKKASGDAWSNGETIATVSHVEDGNRVYTKETKTWMVYSALVLVKTEKSPIELTIELLESELLKLKLDEEKIENAIKVLKNITI
ncbi:hypothetical protein BSK59_15805 [Paenibacillus odorifer]|uniref:hypothetical protein n=1 Tax=Paenibacillus odorifer TaxID=189426 RepID=UPI00096F331B|nr:hypothetical protein [Paenibacillus odorifer]OME54045.1 hypothetical protein BSK59_15805 [Paenibacillus odorifer]